MVCESSKRHYLQMTVFFSLWFLLPSWVFYSIRQVDTREGPTVLCWSILCTQRYRLPKWITKLALRCAIRKIAPQIQNQGLLLQLKSQCIIACLEGIRRNTCGCGSPNNCWYRHSDDQISLHIFRTPDSGRYASIWWPCSRNRNSQGQYSFHYQFVALLTS